MNHWSDKVKFIFCYYQITGMSIRKVALMLNMSLGSTDEAITIAKAAEKDVDIYKLSSKKRALLYVRRNGR